MTRDTSHSPIGDIPGVFLPHIAEYFARKGGDSSSFWDSAGLSQDSFRPLVDTISEEQLHRFVGAAMQQSGAEFGFEIGEMISIASFGLISRAVMSSGNFRRSTNVLSRYSNLAMPLISVASREDDEEYIVEFRTYSKYAALNRVMVEAVVANMKSAYKLLTAKTLDIEHACFAFPDPGYSKSLLASIAKRTTFSADSNAFHISRKLAEHPFLTASETEARLTLEQCEVELLKNRNARSFRDRVSEQIRRGIEDGPASFDVAKKLNVSERTLRRLLAREGANYRELLNQVREEQAKYYLGQTTLKVAQISERLGYVETSNFRTAFKSWTGDTPSVWRNAHQGDARQSVYSFAIKAG